MNHNRLKTLEVGDIIRIHEYVTPKETNILTYVVRVKCITYFNDVWGLYIESYDKTLASLIYIHNDQWCPIKQIDIIKEAQTHAEIL